MKIPTGLEIEKLAVHPLNPKNHEMGWEAFTFLKNSNGMPIGGGYSIDKELAKTISISETIERYQVRKIFETENSLMKMKWGLNFDHSTAGFAFGDKSLYSMKRSICEAYERYVRYFGIYCGLNLKSHSILKISPIHNYLSSFFDEVRFYTKSDILNIGLEDIKATAVIVLGIKNKGIFIGASCKTINEVELYDKLEIHALIEAYRNFRIFNNHLLINDNQNLIDNLEQRILKSGKDNTQVLQTINSSTKAWNKPIIDILNIEYFEDSNGYLSRCLLKKVPPWSKLSTDKLI